AAADALDHPEHVRMALARRHAVDDLDDAVLGLELRLEDERRVAIAAPRPPHPAAWRDEPAPVLRRAEERGEAGSRVEARDAQPVDRAVAADQRGRLVVADERVVLERQRHAHRLRAATATATLAS